MTNTMIKKSPNQVPPIPRRNNVIRDEKVNNDDGIIYPPEYSVATASPISMNDPNSLPLAPAALIEEHNTHNAEEGRLPTQNSEKSHSKKTDSRFDPFRPIHPQCNHISYGCLTMVFIVFVGMAVLLKTYLPVAFPGVIPYTENEDIKSYDSYQPSPYLDADPLSKVSYYPSSRPTVTSSNPPSISTEPYHSPSFIPTVTRSNWPSMYLSHPQRITRYEEKKLVASDGIGWDQFGRSCSISKELVVIGATWAVDDRKGAAYIFNLDGTEVAKLTPGDDGKDYDYFGYSVSIDEKVVVGTSYGKYVRVLSRQGSYERTIRCDDCSPFGESVATLGNLIAVNGKQNDIWKLFLYTKEGQFIKSLEQGSDWIDAVAMSEQFIVTTGRNGKTFIYSNSSPEFPEIAEINQGGYAVTVSNERLVIGEHKANDFDGAVYLYKIDGTFVETLDRQDASSRSRFGFSVAINDDKVIVSACVKKIVEKIFLVCNTIYREYKKKRK